MIEVPCPKRECKESILRCNISGHLQECMFEDVSCKYANIGCKEKVIRRDLYQLTDHEGDSQQHLQLAIDAVQLQQSTINDMTMTIQSLQKKPLAPTKFIYKFTDFERNRCKNNETFSPAFYTSPDGYKMCICVDANGNGKGEGTHVSVFAHLMKGENDDHLPWPFTGMVTFELLNQLEDKNHHSKTTIFPQALENEVQRVVNQETASTGYGCHRYISHSDLGYNEAKNCQYLKDDCLYFRITVDAERSTRPWLVV